MARPERFELPTYWFEASCSIRLSYGRLASSYHLILSARDKIETEVKIPFSGTADAARTLILGIGYAPEGPRLLEVDVVFDREDGELKLGGQLLRLRRAGDTSTVTYKGPPSGGRYKSREEVEFDISDPAAFETVLERLAYTPRFRYEKYRTKFVCADAHGIITLDETPIGTFLELEGPEAWIDETANALGYTAESYETASYASLYKRYLQTNPGDPVNMAFRGGDPP